MNNNSNFQVSNNSQKRTCPYCYKELGGNETSCYDCYLEQKRKSYGTTSIIFMVIYILIFLSVAMISNWLSDLGNGLGGGSKDDMTFFSFLGVAFVISIVPYLLSLFFSLKSKSRGLIFLNVAFLFINLIFIILSSF